MKHTLIFFVAVMAVLFVSCKKDTEKTYPTDGLVSYFNFDDNLIDQMGNTPEGVNYQNATFTQGQAGKAITLNGANQYIEFARSTFRSGNNISVSLWFKTGTSSHIYFIMCDDFGVFASQTIAGFAISIPLTANASGDITSGEWTHLVGTYDGTDIKSYINGELVGTTSHPGNIAPWVGNLQIGRFDTEYWGGSVDDLFIYDRVLTQADVDQLYNYHR